MSFFRLMWRNAWRKPLRTVLLMVCVAIAFLIYGLGEGFLAGSQGADGADAGRLVVTGRNGPAQGLPFSHFNRIAAEPDVAQAAYSSRIRGFVETQRHVVSASAVDPAALASVMGAELGLTPDLLAALKAARDNVLVGRALAEAMGWRVGQRIAVTPFQVGRADGAKTWSFAIAGIFEGARATVDTYFILARYDYVNAVRARDRDTVDGILVVPRPGISPAALSAEIDAMFASSAAPTRTQSEKAFLEALIRKIADFDLIVALVTGAAFVTILMIVTNTLVFAMRERRFEIGVLKVLGFSRRHILVLVLGEALFVVVGGGLAGLFLAEVGAALLGAEFGLVLPPVLLARAAAILVGLGLFVGLVPAANAIRMPVVNALKSR